MTYTIYALALLVIPFLTQWLKNWDQLPPRVIPWLPPIMGLITAWLVNMQTGMAPGEALRIILEGLSVGGVATLGRQVAVKSIWVEKD